MLFGIEYSFWYSLSLNGKRVWLTQSRMNYKCCTSNISWCIFSSVFKKSKNQIMKIISTFFLGEFWYPFLSEIYLPLFGPHLNLFSVIMFSGNEIKCEAAAAALQFQSLPAQRFVTITCFTLSSKHKHCSGLFISFWNRHKM